jgi:hypothetical protein
MQPKVAVSACIVGAAAKEVGASWSSWCIMVGLIFGVVERMIEL